MKEGWKTQCGEKHTFAIVMAFEPDPDAGAGASCDMEASWGKFQIWIDGKNVCAYTDDGGHVDDAQWYLLPLLEWIT